MKPFLDIMLVTKYRVRYEGHYFLIVPDAAAGKPNRFTVYRIPSSPAGRVKIIGRELPLGHAKKVAQGK